MKNQITIILFKIWPTNRFSKAKSYNFHFHKNYVTWPLSANGLLIVEKGPQWKVWSIDVQTLLYIISHDRQ